MTNENVVEEAARIIAPEAFSDAVWYDGSTGKPVELNSLEKARRAYLKSQAICRAIDVLRLAANTPNLKKLLAQDETDRWEQLGIPRDVLDTPEAQAIIKGKF